MRFQHIAKPTPLFFKGATTSIRTLSKKKRKVPLQAVEKKESQQRTKRRGDRSRHDEAFDNPASVLGKNIFLITDAVENGAETSQDDFISCLEDMVTREGLHVYILLSCRPSGAVYK